MKIIDLLVKELPKRGGWPNGVDAVEQNSAGQLFEMGSDYCSYFKLEKCDDWLEVVVTKKQYEAALAASKAVVGHDGWIKWAGGDCPVDSDAIVEVKFRNPSRNKFNNDRAGDFAWAHDGIDGDIIAYRLRDHDISSRANDDRLEQDLNECIGASDAQAWYGVGLPPVGVKCEFTHGPYSIEAGELTGITPKVGEVVEVVAHRLTSDNNPVAVVYWDDNGAGRSACFVEECFRQIRTEAEMAREKLAASLHIAADASPIELNGIGALYFKLADAIISGSVFGTTFREGK